MSSNRLNRKIKEITNDLGIRRFRGEEIDEEYERDCEIRIRKLKQDFNIWGSEVRKKEKAYEDENKMQGCRTCFLYFVMTQDEYIPLAITPDITDRRIPDNSLNMGMSIHEHYSGKRNRTNDDTKETNVGSITITHANYSLPEYESFHFDNLSFSCPPPKPPDVEISLDFESDTLDIDNLNVLNDESFDPREGENVVFLNVKEDDSFTFTIRTFLPFCPPYPRASPYLHPTGSEDDESLLTLASPLEPLASHREGNFHFA
ncbi:hypothetical protein Tco_0553297 [Tanacetum coccineum]